MGHIDSHGAELTDRQRELIATARTLAAEFAPRAAEHDRDNTFPHENIQALRAAGYLALTVPTEYGGGGATVHDIVLAQGELAKGDAATALAVGMHLILVGKVAETRIWPEPVFARVAREIVDNGALINAANSEPDLGSPSRGAPPSTRAERTDSGWRINGYKRWTSLAPALSYLSVMCTVVDDGPPRRGSLLVPADAPGVEVIEAWDNLGMRATGSHDIRLTNVEVPLDALVRYEGSNVPGDGKGWGGVVTGAVYLGVAEAARDEAVRYATTRVPNGMETAIADLPAVQQRIGQMEIWLLQARTLLHDVARRWVAYPEDRAAMEWELAAAKYTVTNTAIQVVDLALRVAGTAGLDRASPLQRHYRDVRTALNQPPIDDQALVIAAKAAIQRVGGAGTSSPKS